MSQSLAIGQDIPAFLDPRVFRSLATLCKDALAYSGNHAAIRGSVNSVLQQLKKSSTDRFGHDQTIDVHELRGILSRSDPREAKPRAPRPDPVERLFERRRLSPETYQAACDIRRVYDAFGRLFVIQARDYRKPRSGSPQRRDPLDLVSNATAELWQTCYKPWMTAVGRRHIVNQQREAVAHIRIVFAILLDQREPLECDTLFRLERGESQEVLRDELGRFAGYHP